PAPLADQLLLDEAGPLLLDLGQLGEGVLADAPLGGVHLLLVPAVGALQRRGTRFEVQVGPAAPARGGPLAVRGGRGRFRLRGRRGGGHRRRPVRDRRRGGLRDRGRRLPGGARLLRGLGRPVHRRPFRGAGDRGYCGGSGGGVAPPNSRPSSGTWPAGVHCAMPSFQTRLCRVSAPEETWAGSWSAGNGPCCRPSTAMNHCSCCGRGGGTAAVCAGAGRACGAGCACGAGLTFCAICWPAAMPMPIAIPSAAALPGFCAALSIALAAWNREYSPMSPRIPIWVRLSSACSTSLGKETFSMMNRG